MTTRTLTILFVARLTVLCFAGPEDVANPTEAASSTLSEGTSGVAPGLDHGTHGGGPAGPHSAAPHSAPHGAHGGGNAGPHSADPHNAAHGAHGGGNAGPHNADPHNAAHGAHGGGHAGPHGAAPHIPSPGKGKGGGIVSNLSTKIKEWIHRHQPLMHSHNASFVRTLARNMVVGNSHECKKWHEEVCPSETFTTPDDTLACLKDAAEKDEQGVHDPRSSTCGPAVLKIAECNQSKVTYCGEGVHSTEELKACMEPHKAELTKFCKAAIFGAQLANPLRPCNQAIRTYCGREHPHSSAEVKACLEPHQAELTTACRSSIFGHQSPTSVNDCRQAMHTHCGGQQHSLDELRACMEPHKSEFSQECLMQVFSDHGHHPSQHP